MSSAVAKLKRKLNGLSRELEVTYAQLEEAESADRQAKERVFDLHEKLRNTLESEHDVQIPVEAFTAFIRGFHGVMTIGGGVVQFFETVAEMEAAEGAVNDTNAVRIFAKEWYVDGCE